MFLPKCRGNFHSSTRPNIESRINSIIKRCLPFVLIQFLFYTLCGKDVSLLHPGNLFPETNVVESSWNVIAHGDAREGKWRGNWRMQWVASNLHTTSEHGASSITTADAHTSAASSRLNWRPPQPWADLNGLVHFAYRRNLVSARVPSHFNWSLLSWSEFQ